MTRIDPLYPIATDTAPGRRARYSSEVICPWAPLTRTAYAPMRARAESRTGSCTRATATGAIRAARAYRTRASAGAR